LVSEELPVLDEQTLDTKEDESLEPEVVIPEPPSRQEMVKGFVSSLQAKSLRKYNPNVSVLGEAPDWAMLDRYQGVITRKDFERFSQLSTQLAMTGSSGLS